MTVALSVTRRSRCGRPGITVHVDVVVVAVGGQRVEVAVLVDVMSIPHGHIRPDGRGSGVHGLGFVVISQRGGFAAEAAKGTPTQELALELFLQQSGGGLADELPSHPPTIEWQVGIRLPTEFPLTL